MVDLMWLAEQRIQEAIRNGDADDLPGAGRPLKIPQGVGTGELLYMTVLRNANVVPPEVELLNRRAALRKEIAEETDAARKAELVNELAGVQTELDIKFGTIKPPGNGAAVRRYKSVKSGGT